MTRFGLSWTVENRMKKDFFDKYWPIEKYQKVNFKIPNKLANILQEAEKTGKNYIHFLLEILEDTVKNCPAKCLICADDLHFAGIKPTVCEKQLCIFGFVHFLKTL